MSELGMDNIFKDKLHGYESQVPEDMWQRIQKKEKRRRIIPPFWWFVLAGMMLGGVAGGYFLLQKNDNATAIKQLAADKTNARADSVIAKNNSSESFSDNHQQQLKAEDNSAANNAPAKNNSLNEGIAKQNSLNASSEFEQSRKNFADKKTVKEISEPVPGINKYSKEKVQNNAAENNNATAIANSIELNNGNSNLEKTADSLTYKGSEVSMTKKEPGISTETSAKKMSEPISVRLSKPVQFYLDVYASPDMPLSKLRSDSSYYLSEKKKSSQFMVSQTYGARLGIKINEHFSAKLGLQYSSIQEKFSYNNNNAVRFIDVPVTRVVTDSSGTAQFIKDTVLYAQYGSRHVTSYNHFRSWDLPLLIGYETGNDKLRISLNAGVILNISSGYTGKFLDASLQPVDIDSVNAYRRNTGASLYFGVGLVKSIGDKMDLFTEPYFRYRMSNMAGVYVPFSQRIHIGGLSVGLRYHFLQAGQHK